MILALRTIEDLVGTEATWPPDGNVVASSSAGLKRPPAADDQVVVLERRAVAELDDVSLRPHRGHGALHEPRSLLLRERPELVALRRAEIERLLHEQGLVDEVGLWGDQGQ